ncbi:MAG: tetratricopeptide repeat protein [Planctomycetota bacterium]
MLETPAGAGGPRLAAKAAALGAALLLAGGARAAFPPWEISGAEGLDPALVSALAERAQADLRSALEEVPRAMGVAPGEVPVRWILDFAAARPAGREGGRPEGAPRYIEAGSTAFANGGAVAVEIRACRFLRRPEGIRAAIFHEAAHAVLASRAGSRERYARIPWWFREGLALRGSGEGPERAGELAAYLAFRGRRARDALAGIPFGEPGSRAVVPEEAFLAVDRLASAVGDADFRRLCVSVARGSRLEDELAARFGDLASLRAALRRDAEERLAGLLPPGVELRFRRSLEASEKGGPAAAEASWRELLEEDPRGALSSTLRYLLGRALLEGPPGSARAREAEEHLRGLIDGPSPLWRPEALVLLGERLARDGRSDEARDLWEEAIYAFGDDAALAARARRNLERLPSASTSR